MSNHSYFSNQSQRHSSIASNGPVNGPTNGNGSGGGGADAPQNRRQSSAGAGSWSRLSLSVANNGDGSGTVGSSPVNGVGADGLASTKMHLLRTT